MTRMRMFLALGALALIATLSTRAGTPPRAYTVLAPITHGNLTIFPVVAAETHDTGQFLTLDEGVRSGEVVVSEAGRVLPLIRRREPPPYRLPAENVIVA